MRPGQGAGRAGEAHRSARARVRRGGSRVARAGARGDQGRLNMLEGKVALVTGASRGIGRAIAVELLKQGAKVVGTATTQEGAAAITAGGLLGKVLNVRDAAQCDAVIGEIQKELGDILILVNNAAVTRDNLALRMKDADWDEVMDINLRAVFRLSRAVMRGMMKA